jgi:AraC-like DNA-binding protein
MSVTTEFIADTTDLDRMSGILDDTLESLRVRGSILLREPYAPPWSIAIPDKARLAELLDARAGVHVVAFHLVEFGHCELEADDGKRIYLKAGEIAVCFGGQAHRLSQGYRQRPQPIESLLSGGANRHHPDTTGRSAGASLICGVFQLHYTAFNPLFAALPSVAHVQLSPVAEMQNVSGVARLLAAEVSRSSPGKVYVVGRLLEVLCAEAVRAYVEARPSRNPGWIRAIKDPVNNWSVRHLADYVAMSPSRFAARFSETVGDSPMAYITKWRINIACRQLASSQQSLQAIAMNIGYESTAAFSRAFKKHMGISPAAWRVREKPAG